MPENYGLYGVAKALRGITSGRVRANLLSQQKMKDDIDRYLKLLSMQQEQSQFQESQALRKSQFETTSELQKSAQELDKYFKEANLKLSELGKNIDFARLGMMKPYYESLTEQTKTRTGKEKEGKLDIGDLFKAGQIMQGFQMSKLLRDISEKELPKEKRTKYEFEDYLKEIFTVPTALGEYLKPKFDTGETEYEAPDSETQGLIDELQKQGIDSLTEEQIDRLTKDNPGVNKDILKVYFLGAE